MAERDGVSPVASPGTLGEVLYSGGSLQLQVAEREWVALVQAIAARDQLALHALYERCHRLVFTLSARITGNRETAEELTLDVFHEVWRRAASYDAANGTVLGWVMNLARSRAIDRLRFDTRKKRVEPGTEQSPFAPVAATTADFPDALVAQEQARALAAALGLLTAAERQAIEAAFFLDLSHAEVAAKLEQPLGTVKTRIRSGLHKLRQALQAEETKR